MTQLIQPEKFKNILPEEISKQLRDLGVSPEDLVQQFVSLDLSLDEVFKKAAALGVPGFVLVVILSYFGSVPLVNPLVTSLAGPIGVISDSLAGFAVEFALVNFYLERLKKGSLDDLLAEIDILPFTDTLKIKVKDRLANEPIPKIERIITIVQD